MLKHKNEKRWFSLSFEKGNPPAIRVAIWEPCVNRLRELLAMQRDIPNLIKAWKFEHYEPDIRKSFGFDKAIGLVGILNGYLTLKAPLLRKQHATAVSLGLLLQILRYFPGLCEDIFKEKSSTDPSRLQLIELESWIVSRENWNSAPLGGAVSPAFTDWIRHTEKERSQLEEVEEAMWLAWNAMSEFTVRKREGPDPYLYFTARLGEKGSFSLNCLGNACDISTLDWWQDRDGEGHELGCHNLDSPMQQLSLLAGLATMHDLVSKDIDP